MPKPKESKSSPVLVIAVIAIVLVLAAMTALLFVLTQKQEPEVHRPSGYVQVTVTEDGYLYENSTYTFESLHPVLTALPEDTGVRITQEGDAEEAVRTLTDALYADGIPYEVQASIRLQ